MKDDLESVFESLCKPPRKVVDKKVVAVAPHVISEKSRKSITVAAEATQYYPQVGRDIIPTKIHWRMLIKFDIQWNVLQDIKKQDSHEVPNLTKNNSRIKWLDSF